MATANGTGTDARLNSSPVSTTAGDGDDGVTTHAATLLDIVREIRAWGSVGLFGAADWLEALAQGMAPEAPLIQIRIR